jgi:hypothetical protein
MKANNTIHKAEKRKGKTKAERRDRERKREKNRDRDRVGGVSGKHIPEC